MLLPSANNKRRQVVGMPVAHSELYLLLLLHFRVFYLLVDPTTALLHARQIWFGLKQQLPDNDAQCSRRCDPCPPCAVRAIKHCGALSFPEPSPLRHPIEPNHTPPTVFRGNPTRGVAGGGRGGRGGCKRNGVWRLVDLVS